MSTISKAIEEEKKVNSWGIKGSIDKLTLARFKVYHAAKIVAVKFDDKNEKKFNPHKLSKMLSAVEKDKAAIAISEKSVAADKKEHGDHHEGAESDRKSKLS